jgi:hypothetical protein
VVGERVCRCALRRVPVMESQHAQG